MSKRKEGKGNCSLQPWIIIQNVPSSGRAHRIIGWKTASLFLNRKI
ncbi:hypothetical protein [Lysinibacillus sp. G01H]|nr:hypothetical protein [Lysinibacillus sp. G01H]WDU77709.1 hypothetical protein PSR12_13525 [Lysinibacillus sp. G01H]